MKNSRKLFSLIAIPIVAFSIITGSTFGFSDELIRSRKDFVNSSVDRHSITNTRTLNDLLTVKLTCPLSSCKVLRGFQLGAEKWNAGHRGVDLSGAKGQIIYAPADGEIIYAGMLATRNVVSIRHDGDLRSTFEPINPLVKVGDKVKQGEIVGLLIDGHCENETCLHWGLKIGAQEYLNPLDFLRHKKVRLLS